VENQKGLEVARHGRPRLSRRRFLFGAGTLTAAGVAAVAGVDVTDHSLFQRGVHRIGLASSPNRQFPPSGATERSGSLDSRYMGGHIGWTVSLPEGDAPPTGVIICLHGYHDNHRFAFDQIHLPDAAASVGLGVAVAAVDGGTDSYWHKRINGTDALSMLLLEFIPMVRTVVGDVPQTLMGWSMGGYGALLAAERDPSNFVGVAPASPALWLKSSATAPGAFDNPADFYANDVFTHVDALQKMAVATACGTGDPFYAATRHLVDSMNFPHKAFFGPGYHDAAYWRSVAPDQLRALSSVLA
jgi:enterochelin esterase-like enzyme